MSKEPDYQLEYVYTKGSFKRAMWFFIGLWVVTRVARAIFYYTTGVALFSTSLVTLLIVFATGIVVGLAVMYTYVYFKSVRVEDIEREKSRLNSIKKNNTEKE